MATGIWQIWREVTFTYPGLPFYLTLPFPLTHIRLSSSIRFFIYDASQGKFSFCWIYTIHDTLFCYHCIPHGRYICILRPYTYAFETGRLAFFHLSWDIIIGLWRLRFGLLRFPSLQCNCSRFLFPFGCKKWLRWGVYLVYIC